MFKRIPDERLNEVSGAGNTRCKCVCPEICACDAELNNGATNYVVMVDQAAATVSATNFHA